MALEERTPGAVTETQEHSITWHYCEADEDFGEIQASVLQEHLEKVLGNQPVEISLDSKQLHKWTDGSFTRVAQVTRFTSLLPPTTTTTTATCSRRTAAPASLPLACLSTLPTTHSLTCVLTYLPTTHLRTSLRTTSLRRAQEHVGDWLSAWIALGGALSAVGLLNTLLCTAARYAGWRSHSGAAHHSDTAHDGVGPLSGASHNAPRRLCSRPDSSIRGLASVAVSAARLSVLPSCLGTVDGCNRAKGRSTPSTVSAAIGHRYQATQDDNVDLHLSP